MLRDILPVLAYLRDKRYVHADVKPTNILFNSTTGHFKLHDFSFAGPQGQREKMQGTLEYMSPEIYSRKLYTPAADMWALGCATVAVYSNAHPFRFKKLQNGRDITVYWEKFLGPIPAPLLMTLEHANMNNPEAHRSVLHARPLIDQVLHKDQLLLDLVKRMLKYNRDERLTPQQALQHPFLNDVI